MLYCTYRLVGIEDSVVFLSLILNLVTVDLQCYFELTNELRAKQIEHFEIGKEGQNHDLKVSEM